MCFIFYSRASQAEERPRGPTDFTSQQGFQDDVLSTAMTVWLCVLPSPRTFSELKEKAEGNLLKFLSWNVCVRRNEVPRKHAVVPTWPQQWTSPTGSVRPLDTAPWSSRPASGSGTPSHRRLMGLLQLKPRAAWL